MVVGLAFTFTMIVLMRADRVLGFAGVEAPIIDSFFGVNAQGVGTVGMVLAFFVIFVVSKLTPSPPESVQQMVSDIRRP